MPVDPRVGRIILAGHEHGVLPEILVIAAALEIQDPRERPPEKRQAADEAQTIFQDPKSDFLSLLRLWKFYHQQRENLSRNRLEKACRSRFLSPTRLREWADIYRQLRELAGSLEPRSHGQPRKRSAPIGQPRVDVNWDDAEQAILNEDRYRSIHQALLAGLLSGSALRGDKHEYTGAGGLKLSLWPGSGVFGAKPKWIVAAELLETSKQYARCVASIQPEWLEIVGQHLVKRTYSDPHWSDRQGGAFCYERVSLFGLPVVSGRRVPLAPIDPTTSRELLIEQGLVERKLPTRARCVTHNRRLRDAISDLAAKTRSRDLVIDDFTILHFYQDRLPPDVLDRATLERWDRDLPIPAWSKQLGDADRLSRWLESPPSGDAARDTPYMRPEDLLRGEATPLEPAAFPSALDIGQTQLPLDYRFEPGAEDDGITVTVPQAALSQISDHRLGWLVPGLLEEKIAALIKALPKRIRRNLVPAAETARRVRDELRESAGQIPFMPSLCAALSRHAEMSIEETDFDQTKLAPHFRFHVRVVDDAGRAVASGRSIGEVRSQLHLDPESTPQAATEHVEQRDADLDRDGLKDFEIDELPEEVVRQRGGVQVAQYPALIDRGESVDVRVFADRGAAEIATRQGLMRLFAIAERKVLRGQVRWLPEVERSRLLMAHALPSDQFNAQLTDLLARRAFVDGEPLVRTPDAFTAKRQERGRRIAIATQDVATWLPKLATAIHAVRVVLETAQAPALKAAIGDVNEQLQRLLQPGFMQTTPWEWLQHYPRYFTAVEYRLDKVRSGAANKDRELTATVNDLWQGYLGMLENDQADQGKAAEVRWLIEELRVSLFAQPLGTAVKVSPTRIEKMLKA